MQPALTYRIAVPEDAAQLLQLGISAYSPFATTLTPDNWSKLDHGLRDEQKREELLLKSTCFICLAGTGIVGMAYLIPKGNPWDIFEAEWSYIRMVGVHPDYRGLGIARKLTSLCIDHAVATGETVIALHTSEFMDAARHLYESLGFRKVLEMEVRLGKRYWLYHLKLRDL